MTQSDSWTAEAADFGDFRFLSCFERLSVWADDLGFGLVELAGGEAVGGGTAEEAA